MLGIMPTAEALSKARELGLNLIEISPKANPPVAGVEWAWRAFPRLERGERPMPRLPLPRATGLVGVCAGAALTERAQADAVADFYRGKTVTIIVGYTAGGGYDLYARLVAPFLSRHIPGQPTVIVQNMAGAGGLRAARNLATAAPKDGTTLAGLRSGREEPQARVQGGHWPSR